MGTLPRIALGCDSQAFDADRRASHCTVASSPVPAPGLASATCDPHAVGASAAGRWRLSRAPADGRVATTVGHPHRPVLWWGTVPTEPGLRAEISLVVTGADTAIA